MKKIIALIGPTGSGKTSISLNLAQKLNASIINCDCRCIYRGLNIGTAKPSERELATVKHYLIDIINPDEIYTVGNYKQDALNILNTISNHDYIIVCGGTGLYASALLLNWQIPEFGPNPDLRNKLNQEANAFGNIFIHEQLAKLDRQSPQLININDRVRIIRAIEICLLSGQKASQIRTKNPPLYDVLWVGLTTSNKLILQARITERFNQMLIDGLLAEVIHLYETYGKTQILTNSVNYKEFIDYLEDKITYAQALALALNNNFRLAKKQIAWFKANKNTNWFNIDEGNQNDIINKIMTWL